MARTWQGGSGAALPANFDESHSEGPAPAIVYHATRAEMDTTIPGHDRVRAPVEATVGGSRHGVSFLMRLRSIDGASLARAPLIEARFLHGAHERGLVLSPGFPAEKPSSFEPALGRVLSPGFEKKCLDCHGQPGAAGAAGGVHCESCHGAGKAHLEAAAAQNPRAGFGKASESCEKCHSGFAVLTDPIPDDLLISNQVNALKNSECFVQSGGRIGCLGCHDPHNDSAGVAAKSLATCLSCHSARVVKHAGLCPVNRASGCVECHMPSVIKGPFSMVDHWIRVHPGSAAKTTARGESQVRPRRVFLWIIVTDDASKAVLAHQTLSKGEEFFDVAQELSSDPSSTGGGYLGEMLLDQMDAKLGDAAARLNPGEFSPVIDTGSRKIIIRRSERDFRERADELQQRASEFRARGELAQAAEMYTKALRIYPRFLRALIFLGASYGQQGAVERAAGILEFAARLYPKDPAAQYNLAIAYGAVGRAEDEIRAYRRALEIEPDLIPAYQNLGAALYAAGQTAGAIEIYRRGLQIDSLSAALNYNLGILTDSEPPVALARKLDPNFVAAQDARKRK